ncbi:MAG TPA: CSLREA domain-containing protein, partial [Chthoniobacterales bacterium]|nr:CSLREA domain-containing protein [Chthoniobacterales bacterium]
MKARSAARRFCKTFGLLAVGFLLVQQPGAAATLTVTNLNDSGPGSLRDRIAVANAGDTITFSVNGTIDLLSTLTINKRLTISHPTGNLTLRGGSDGSTLIEITGTLVSMFDLSVLGSFDGRGIGLAVRKGASAIVSRCEFTRFRIGVLNDGGLTLLDCTVSLNLSVNSTSCQPLLGAGIVNRATISLSACSIYDNTVRYDLTCADMPDNGGLANTGVADAVNTTFWRNGVHNDAAGTLTLRSCTLSSSSITNASGAVDIGNTILHQSVIMNSLAGNFTSAGYNLSDTGGQGHLTATGDLSNAEPKLGSFNFHGGFTRSFALARGSAAIDRGAAFGISQDQRGQNRPVDFTGYPNATNGTDIGAHEVTETAQSGNLIVTISTDTNDGVCGTIDCSLREAINAANALAGDNTITFDEAITGTLAPASALPAIASNIHLQGPGARLLALSGSAQRRVLVFSSGSSSLSGLTIRNGAQFGTSVSPATGGGLANAAALTVSDCAFIGNFAFGFDAASPGGIGGPGLGGAIANTIGGNLTLERCTFSSNGVDGGLGAANSGAFNSGGAGGAAYGGAIYNDSSSTVALVNCTLAGNSATGGAGGSNTGTNGFGGNGGPGGGGGIFSRGTLSLTSCTFRSNTGAGGAGGQGSGLVRNGVAGPGTGGIENDSGSATIRNTIV